MPGEKLHDFDLALCSYIRSNFREHLGDRHFWRAVEDDLSAVLIRFLTDDTTARNHENLLLNFDERLDIEGVAEDLAFCRKQWLTYPALHRSSIDCVIEIREALTRENAEEWASLCRQFSDKLEKVGLAFEEGVFTTCNWIFEVHRFLRAMGAIAWLPYPEGHFGTPTNPMPAILCAELKAKTPVRHLAQCDNLTASTTETKRLQPDSPAAVTITETPALDPSQHSDLVEAIAETKNLQREVRDLLLTQKIAKEFYTTTEVGQILDRAEYTVREWCRQGRIRGKKKLCGRGKGGEWLVSHEELQRVRNEGLLAVERLE